jgi:phage tail sheath gpL-like
MSGATGDIIVPGYNPNNLVPGIYAGFDASNANTSPGPNQQTLIIGQIKGATRTFVAGVPQLIGSTAAAIAACGNDGCLLAKLITRYRQDDPQGTVWVLPLLDDGSASQATNVIVFTGTATAAGAVYLYVGGVLTTTAVNVGDTATVVAGNVAATIDSTYGVPASAAAATGTLTITAEDAGIDAGEGCQTVLNYLGAQGGQVTPAGITIGAPTFTAGTVNPVTGLTAALANCGTMNFDFIVFPYTDTTSMNLISAFLSQSTGRWSIQQQLYGAAFLGFSGTLSQRTTWSDARDDQFLTAISNTGSPTPAYEWAASFAAVCAASVRVNPAIPLGWLPMSVLPPQQVNIDIPSEQQTLLTSGLSTYYVSGGGVVYLQRAVTFYVTNPQGYPDNSWRDVNTLYTLMACIRQMIRVLSSQFQRKILVADGTVVAGGTGQVTSQTVLAAANAIYVTLCNQAWAQSPTVFIQNSRAQNQGNGTVTLFLPIDVADQLWIIAIDCQFLKS